MLFNELGHTLIALALVLILGGFITNAAAVVATHSIDRNEGYGYITLGCILLMAMLLVGTRLISKHESPPITSQTIPNTTR